MCYNGQSITSECDILLDRIYASNWIEMIDGKRHGDYGRLVYMLMEHLKYNKEVLIGKLHPLSLSTFKSVGGQSSIASEQFNSFEYSNFNSRLCRLPIV